MRRAWSGIAAALALSLAGAAAANDLSSRLDAALRSRALRDASIGVLVVAQDDGRVLYERRADRALTPASNQKILTAIAALSVFGPAHRFVTQIYADAPPDAEGGVDVLAIRGGGDPSLTSEQYWRLAADLRLLGIRRVRNGLLLDASAFDGERWHPSWGQTSARAYHAPVAALSANYGAFSATVEPGAKPGDPVRVLLDPPVPHLQLHNRAKTGNSKSATSLAVDRMRSGGVEEVVVSGSVRAASAAKAYHRSVLDPVRYAGSVLRAQLEANGISVEGENRLGVVPESMLLLDEFEGKSLADAVQLFLKYSNNTMGEMLVKALGVRSSGIGSWSAGIAAVRAELERLEIDVAGLSIVDGSGLSYQNRVTPRALVSALRVASASFDFGPEFVAALPIAAADGTLEKRTEGAADRVRAKTGLLTRVTSLSGYAMSADDRPLVFSVLVNGFGGSDEAAMAAVDRFASELTQSRIGAAAARDQGAR
ncbi:MAG: D-alanyl-D-alanine carboxypeptidase/D-alanyl-D-alanine-endopeptidase [Deltaproteobacteria bacterium]|jgi:D-alanyl-D-alanine carboxypeptidase/D-alanyl-D-alanine-endopeptidase (penicillin-binding protein 4)|nr:D-alanyl-D-alanine carboxypeptidase/D-alanyl-D-alanine-endopeptidase [Deltaproteobacteria bacterium]